MKRILICLLLGFIATASGECRAQAEKIDSSSDPNFSKLSPSLDELSLDELQQKMDELRQKKAEYLKELREKAEAGEASSQCALGYEYLDWEKDYKEAFKWFSKAAEQEYPAAQHNLGVMYLNGVGVKQNYNEAAKWFRKAAEQGYAAAQHNLGLMYYNSQGVEQDYKKAFKWFHKAAEQGDVTAQYNLGWMYYQGRGIEKDYQEAAKWFRKAAEQGNADAQYNIGLMYYNGEGLKQYYQEADKWYRRAAEQVHTAAQYNLGLMYDTGRGVEQDYIEAVKWYYKAAEQGNASAQYHLGLMYIEGQGVEQDYKEAVKWYRKAAEQGDADSQLLLGIMYRFGKGVIEDYAEAYKWYLLAGMNGLDVSENKKYIQRKMTTAQIAEAQRRAKAFVARKETKADPGEESSIIKSTGTGFFINSQGYLLTSQHVIEDAKTVKVLTDKGIFPATLIHADSFNDIAILKVQGQEFRALSIISSKDVKTGDKVFTIGFPNVGLQGFEPKYTEGVISSLSGAKDDPRYFQISTPVQPGNSGGPLINDKGEVVGIITARLSTASSLATTGALPQNVNYALKSSYVRAFLEVLPKVADQSLKNEEQSADSHTAQIKKAQEAVALVLSY